MTVEVTLIEPKVHIAKFIEGPRAGEEVEGPFIEGLMYEYDDVHYLCTQIDDQYVLREVRDNTYDLLATMLPIFYI